MNCMVERRRDDPMERRFPFNILGAFAPRNAHAERIAIICHGGDEPRLVRALCSAITLYLAKNITK